MLMRLDDDPHLSVCFYSRWNFCLFRGRVVGHKERKQQQQQQQQQEKNVVTRRYYLGRGHWRSFSLFGVNSISSVHFIRLWERCRWSILYKCRQQSTRRRCGTTPAFFSCWTRKKEDVYCYCLFELVVGNESENRTSSQHRLREKGRYRSSVRSLVFSLCVRNCYD